MTTLSYSSTDENVEDLEDLHKQLLQLMTKFKSKLPQQEGLFLRPQLRKQLKLSRQKKISLRSKHTQELPPSSRRGRKKLMHTETELEKGSNHERGNDHYNEC